MSTQTSLRDLKKTRTRQHIADVAAALFAERGYDAVTMLAVARAAEVSDQTVYNYFPAKQDLVLDRAEQVRELYRDAVTRWTDGTSPASALLPMVRADVERYRTADLDVAKGEFIAQSVESAVLRRFALEERERQTRVIAGAVLAATPVLPTLVAHGHAAAIVSVIQAIYDQIGASVLNRVAQDEAAQAMLADLGVAFASLDRSFAQLVADAGLSSA